MKRFVPIILAVFWVASMPLSVEAQGFGAPEAMKGKIVVGGDFGLGCSGNSFYVSVAPQIGYRLTRNLEVGTRLGYDMNYYLNSYYYGSYFCHYFSGALYANYEIFSGIYVQVEDEEMCRLVSGNAIISNNLQWFNSLFVGAGYRQYYSERSFVYYAFLYNLSWDYTGTMSSPYSNPFVIRMGICYAL